MARVCTYTYRPGLTADCAAWVFVHSIYTGEFFFQAEDGIRGRYVTGVQTCALPISRPCSIPRTVRGSNPCEVSNMVGCPTVTPLRPVLGAGRLNVSGFQLTPASCVTRTDWVPNPDGDGCMITPAVALQK